ncbi:MAG TPA: transposase [Candidatus Paceibacterota bacterium]|nr:transposase [Candidatus Paceibacterota bacterium]
MHLRGQVLAAGETYHVFNRGAHKQAICTSAADYERLLLLLYLYNTPERVVTRDVLSKYSTKRHKNACFTDIFRREYSEKSLVDILAYCLMPNHFHLIVRPKTDTSLQTFVQKVCVAYSMYFNTKYLHSGTIFQGRYKAVHVESDSQFRYLFAYVHLNPLDLLQSDWKEVGIRNERKARTFLSEYRYSSFLDASVERPQRAILAEEIPEFLKEQNDVEELMQWQQRIAHP